MGSHDYGTVTVPAIALWQDPGADRGAIVGSPAHASAVKVLDRRYVPEQQADLYLVTTGEAEGWVHEQSVRNTEPGDAPCR